DRDPSPRGWHRRRADARRPTFKAVSRRHRGRSGYRKAVNCRLSEAADEGITDILKETARWFGPSQRKRYAALIGKAVEMSADEPERLGSRPRGGAPVWRPLNRPQAARYRRRSPDGELPLLVMWPDDLARRPLSEPTRQIERVSIGAAFTSSPGS